MVSDSLITATYPATLSAATLAVHLTGSTGGIRRYGRRRRTAGLPGGDPARIQQTPARVIAAVFDPERQVLYVAASLATNNNPSNAANQIWRYSYAGGVWSQATVIAIPYLHDVALPGDGSKLQVLTTRRYSSLTPPIRRSPRGPRRPRSPRPTARQPRTWRDLPSPMTARPSSVLVIGIRRTPPTVISTT